jgi:excisionase family DNA binding protein
MRSEHKPRLPQQTMTAKQVSETTGLPLRTVYAYAQSGQLPAIHIGRQVKFLRSTIDQLLASGSFSAPAERVPVAEPTEW